MSREHDTGADTPRVLSRRNFLIFGGGAIAAVAAGGGAMAATAAPGARGKMPPGLVDRPNVRQLALSVTDGWAGMPRELPVIDPYFPDTLAPAPLDTYIFGFRDVTGLDRPIVQSQAGKAQISAPVIEATVGEEVWITLSNLGLLTRPDLVDSHTLHWHGFRNAIPYYDGVPETSISVPIGRDFTYVFRPEDAGTYMYHCHFEDVEHVTMGMTGIVFVRPAANSAWAYDDPDTEFDVEMPIMLTEFDLAGHWNDAHIQTSDWTSYKPDVWLMNGRAYPDTLAPSGVRDDITGDLVPQVGFEHLQYQPQTSKIRATGGQRVLLRIANLGFQEQTLAMPGIDLVSVGSDARWLTPDQRTVSDTLVIGAGESRDVIFVAPQWRPDGNNTYPLFNTDPTKYRGNLDGSDQWVGGQRTELEVEA
ncbi:MAG: multicopper oxidase domain-containing protein [Actinobacteria bacterium]|nr:multicopper oxidase domain-containing protein [Actinomycetota bacterium]